LYASSLSCACLVAPPDLPSFPTRRSSDLQRKYIYAMRRAVLEDQDISTRLEEMFANLVDDAIEIYAPDNVIPEEWDLEGLEKQLDRKSTRLNSSHVKISYAVFCLKKKNNK